MYRSPYYSSSQTLEKRTHTLVCTEVPTPTCNAPLEFISLQAFFQRPDVNRQYTCIQVVENRSNLECGAS